MKSGLLSTRPEKGFFRAANPRNSEISPMEVVGQCVILLIPLPVDSVFPVLLLIVPDLPYAVLLRAAFRKRKQECPPLPREDRIQAHISFHVDIFLMA